MAARGSCGPGNSTVEQRTGIFELRAVLGVPLGVALALTPGRRLRDAHRGAAENSVQTIAQLAEHPRRHRDERLRVSLLTTHLG